MRLAPSNHVPWLSSTLKQPAQAGRAASWTALETAPVSETGSLSGLLFTDPQAFLDFISSKGSSTEMVREMAHAVSQTADALHRQNVLAVEQGEIISLRGAPLAARHRARPVRGGRSWRALSL